MVLATGCIDFVAPDEPQIGGPAIFQATLRVADDGAVRIVGELEPGIDEDGFRRTVASEPVEGERALPEPVEQAGVGEQLEVAGDARLALSENLREIAHRELCMRAQREDSKPGGLRDRLERLEEPGHRNLVGVSRLHGATVARNTLDDK